MGALQRTSRALIAVVQVGGTFGDEVVPRFCLPK